MLSNELMTIVWLQMPILVVLVASVQKQGDIRPLDHEVEGLQRELQVPGLGRY